MSDAMLLSGEDRPAIRFERHLPDPPDVVWRALTDREQLRSWFPCDVIVNGGRWEVGATITFPFPSDVLDLTLTGEVLEVDAPHVLAYTWGDDTLRFELTADGDGTRLVLVDELPPESAARNAAGWERCLDRLEGLEPGSDGWEPRYEHYVAAFESTVGPQQRRPQV